MTAIAIIAVLLGGLGWRIGKPYLDQQRYLAEERRWHSFFLPRDTVVHTTDPAVIAAHAKPGQRPYGYFANGGDWSNVRYFDQWPALPRVGNTIPFGPCAFMCLLRSPGGTERIVRVGTQTVERFPDTGLEVSFLGEIQNCSSWTPGNRGAAWGFGGYGADIIRLKPQDRFTIYAGVRAADQMSVTLPYRLNDEPGEFLVRLNDDGTVSITVKSGNADLVK